MTDKQVGRQAKREKYRNRTVRKIETGRWTYRLTDSKTGQSHTERQTKKQTVTNAETQTGK